MLATTTLPWPAPDPTKFSSIHSNPPWLPTDRPEVVFHRFGEGKAIYSSSLLENIEGMKDTFLQLLRLLNNTYRFEADAPSAVELTMFRQPDRKRYLLSLVNFQKDLPNIPVDGIRVRLRLEGERIQRVIKLPESRKIEHREEGGVVTFTAPRLETLTMFALETE